MPVQTIAKEPVTNMFESAMIGGDVEIAAGGCCCCKCCCCCSSIKNVRMAM